MLSRSKDLLQQIAKRDREIASLKIQVSQAQQAVRAAEALRKVQAAEQAIEKERALENRISDAVRAIIRGGKLSAQPAPMSVSPDRVTPSKPTRKMAAKASSRPRARRVPRGADTDNMVLSLLTNELKCIGTLFRQAQGLGFSGTENAIRFAGVRLAQAGNAIEGRDYQDRIAYRRA
ncbi:hypothetical protein [Sphingomonas sp. TX0522]|uniref:hypothetical protein n=1 Tax=Sphingomonas sp. TX0522 TaxID=2479205 RepID=UPI0018E04CF8|nr:hypothetical protein [Sphingomonas sp. TX0522]MBI0533849.1 hypothetical protein [Sphingomonas sp. TX0522]